VYVTVKKKSYRHGHIHSHFFSCFVVQPSQEGWMGVKMKKFYVLSKKKLPYILNFSDHGK